MKTIVDCLEFATPENPVDAGKLIDALGMRPQDELEYLRRRESLRAIVRREIKALRDDGVQIGANRHGYYLERGNKDRAASWGYLQSMVARIMHGKKKPFGSDKQERLP